MKLKYGNKLTQLPITIKVGMKRGVCENCGSELNGGEGKDVYKSLFSYRILGCSYCIIEE